MSPDPVPAASYGGVGAWSAAELDSALLASEGIRAVVTGDAHHPAPLFTGHQVVLLVSPEDLKEVARLLGEHGGERSPA